MSINYLLQGYYTGYYSLLLMPLGLIFCLLIKFGADFSSSNRALTIYSRDEEEAKEVKNRKANLINTVLNVQLSNDNQFVIKGLPIKSGDILLSQNGYEARKSKRNLDQFDYLGLLLDFKSRGVKHNDMLLAGKRERCYNDFAARESYDDLIEQGIIKIGKSDTAEGFLDRNGIISIQNLEFKSLIWLDGCPEMHLAFFNKLQNKVFEERKTLFSPENALLLLLSVKDSIKVINC